MALRRKLDEAQLKELRRQAAEILDALNSFDEVVEAYLKGSAERVDRFGMMAVDRPDFVHRMRKGKDFRRSTILRVAEYMSRDDEKCEI